ncbi:hypothetical protein BC835DRAFT_1370485 [Cytidiella melzeri]|nr:hypothetical protein BC835DRAFT_1370485 [Cytidiella melzeri]
MSDLDADLYGDLYGNDEAEYTEEPETPSNAASEPAAPAKEPAQLVKVATAPKPTTTSPPKPEQPESAHVEEEVHDMQSLNTAQEHASYDEFATQQIPTYQERQEPEYHDLSAQRLGGDFGMNRPVRPSEMKEEGKMFIGGLNWDTTDESLRKYFTQFGKVEACTIMRDAAGRSRCFAFLTFEEPQSVNAVMVREHFLDGKIIDPKRAIPRQEHQRATKLFIGGLAGSVTSESMREFFSQFGKVVDATVMLDRETGRSKGFGFVSFENVNVDPLLGFGNLEIDGKVIDVKLAQPRSQREGGGGFNEIANVSGGGGRNNQFNNSNFQGGPGNFTAGATAVAAPAAGVGAGGNAPFDPQALASLYTRMITQMGGMNPMMGGGLNPMMGGMGGAGAGYGNPMSGAMRMPGMGGPMGAGAMMGGMGGMGGMGMGMGRGMGGAAMMGGGPMNQNIPRGPRGGGGGPGANVGPQRAGQRGTHSYHPYAR